MSNSVVKQLSWWGFNQRVGLDIVLVWMMRQLTFMFVVVGWRFHYLFGRDVAGRGAGITCAFVPRRVMKEVFVFEVWGGGWTWRWLVYR